MVHLLTLTFVGRLAPQVIEALPAASRPLMIVVSLAAILAAAAALHYAVERPAREWLRRRLKPAPLAPLPVAHPA